MPYIALEGPDGAGKTTQMKALADSFAHAEKEYILVREPGATDVGKQLREILLTGHADKLDGVTEVLLFSADRRHTIRTLVRPAMAEGKFVLSDRTYLSTLVFQGYGRGLDIPLIEKLTDFAVEDTRPDLMLVLDVPVEVGLGRKDPLFEQGLTESRMESVGTDFHTKNRAGYLEQVAKHPETHTLINAAQTPAEVHREILGVINSRFGTNLQPSI
ncbi:MAG: dTMP kinase [Blastochloris viridis]|uniref:Thymidylate kinase n=1 Tax=Blastochloris viridis TaxID=1079 RepID=A0A6N4RBE3_BLAVI|nr:MAG: dTMP kinase [Blastochloris viridis]